MLLMLDRRQGGGRGHWAQGHRGLLLLVVVQRQGGGVVSSREGGGATAAGVHGGIGAVVPFLEAVSFRRP